MTINQIFGQLIKKLKRYKVMNSGFLTSNLNYLYYSLLIILFLIIIFIASNIINRKNNNENSNLKTIIQSNEFENLSEYFISKINSPYKEVKYQIQNNYNIDD